jgi:hypothetical protein
MRYFIGFLVTVLLIITLIVLLFNGGGKQNVKTTKKSLTSYASTDAEVSMTIAGPIVYNTDHSEVRVTVGRDNVTFQQIKGYDGQVVNTQIFENTQNSYDAFLHALQHAGFTRGDNNPALKNDVGYCSTGQRYIFQMNQDGEELQRYWASGCGGTKTYLGAINLTLTLFQAQVPDYSDLAAPAGL